MLRGNRNILDPTGWTAAALEWYALWWVAGDEEVSKQHHAGQLKQAFHALWSIRCHAAGLIKMHGKQGPPQELKDIQSSTLSNFVLCRAT